MSVEPYYINEEECPICSNTFPVIKVRKKIVKVKQDADFCSYYKDINPYYYDVFVCPGCSFAAAENHFKDMKPVAVNLVSEHLKQKSFKVDITGVRTWEQALVSYKMAVHFALVMKFKDSQIAGLYLKMAWLYRELGSKGYEDKCLQESCKHWMSAISKEPFPIGSMSQSRVEYLVGEICRRLGKYDIAAQYFYGVIHMDNVELEILRMAREAYQLAREEKKAMAEGTSNSEMPINEEKEQVSVSN